MRSTAGVDLAVRVFVSQVAGNVSDTDDAVIGTLTLCARRLMPREARRGARHAEDWRAGGYMAVWRG